MSEGTDVTDLAAVVTELVPFNRLLGARVEEITDRRAVAVLPDDPPLRNHVDTQHAAALFTVAELAAGAALAGACRSGLDRVTFVLRHAEVSYERAARGPVRATATLPPEGPDVLDEVERAGRARVTVTAEVVDDAGVVVCRLGGTYHVRSLPAQE